MIKVICNRCGIDMTKSGAFGRITMEIHKRSDFADSPPESMMRSFECHFCKKCMDAIYDFAITTPKEETNQLTGTELTAEQPKVQRKRIDYGKIMALKNAGWDNGKIADEMHMSKASVSQAVSKYKKMKMEGNLDEAENKGAVSDNQDTV